MVEEKMKVRLVFLQECLGTQPTDENIYQTYIANATKNGNEQTPEMTAEELDNLPKNEDDEDFYRGVTVFPRLKILDAGSPDYPAMYGYMLKGFFKNACSTFREVDESLSSRITAHKKKIDNQVHVNRISHVNVSDDVVEYMNSHSGTLPLIQRPIRISGPSGERVALACSEYIPEGSSVDFEITTFSKEMMNLVIEWLDYGKYNGLGCWHNSGKGQFDWIDIDLGKKREIDPKFLPAKRKSTATKD